jgi:hypothetical protein
MFVVILTEAERFAEANVSAQSKDPYAAKQE